MASSQHKHVPASQYMLVLSPCGVLAFQLQARLLVVASDHPHPRLYLSPPGDKWRFPHSGGRDRSRESPAALDSSRSRGVEGAKVRPGMGSRETIRPRWEPNGREKGLAVIPIACGNSSPCLLSVRKVVPTITSKSAEIYLSMAGAKQHNDTGLSWFRPWAVRPAAVRLGRCIAVHCGACGGE
jgi:hypothetical protein